MGLSLGSPFRGTEKVNEVLLRDTFSSLRRFRSSFRCRFSVSALIFLASSSATLSSSWGELRLKIESKIRMLIGTHILYVFLFALPECPLRRAILLLAFHQARLILCDALSTATYDVIRMRRSAHLTSRFSTGRGLFGCQKSLNGVREGIREKQDEQDF